MYFVSTNTYISLKFLTEKYHSHPALSLLVMCLSHMTASPSSRVTSSVSPLLRIAIDSPDLRWQFIAWLLFFPPSLFPVAIMPASDSTCGLTFQLSLGRKMLTVRTDALILLLKLIGSNMYWNLTSQFSLLDTVSFVCHFPT